MTQPPLILASASPRRNDLLRAVGCEFKVRAADVDETQLSNEAPRDYVSRVAQLKADAISSLNPHAAVLAADTIVACDLDVFGKPNSLEHAQAMWRQLSGRDHEVMTAVCLSHNDIQESAVVTTQVCFTQIPEAAMRRYWQTGEPRDKAGAYAIQGLASAWVQQVHGSYSNVVGLPLFETNQILTSVGHNWL